MVIQDAHDDSRLSSGFWKSIARFGAPPSNQTFLQKRCIAFEGGADFVIDRQAFVPEISDVIKQGTQFIFFRAGVTILYFR